MDLNPDFSDLLLSLRDAGVRYLIVGAYAVAFHTEPRFTKDIDIWVEPTPDNSRRVWSALRAFQAPMTGVERDSFASPDVILQIGVEPNRIDIITSVEGIRFAEAWGKRVEARFGHVPAIVLALEDLINNKGAVGRPQDLLDLERLRRARKIRTKRRKK